MKPFFLRDVASSDIGDTYYMRGYKSHAKAAIESDKHVIGLVFNSHAIGTTTELDPMVEIKLHPIETLFAGEIAKAYVAHPSYAWYVIYKTFKPRKEKIANLLR